MTVKFDKIPYEWAVGLYLKYNVFLFLFSPFFRWRNGMDRLRMEASLELVDLGQRLFLDGGVLV